MRLFPVLHSCWRLPGCFGVLVLGGARCVARRLLSFALLPPLHVFPRLLVCP